MLLEMRGEITPEGMKKLIKVVDTPGGESKVRCFKEQYCIGTCNVRFINQEMARVNTDILGISEVKRAGMGEFNSDDHCSTVGRNPLEEME